jgi:hypothetical protein
MIKKIARAKGNTLELLCAIDRGDIINVKDIFAFYYYRYRVANAVRHRNDIAALKAAGHAMVALEKSEDKRVLDYGSRFYDVNGDMIVLTDLGREALQVATA